jgi:autotransporter passenger strand-loop-strand repeat protein
VRCGVASQTVVNSGGFEDVFAGGTAISATVYASGEELVSSGGTASGTIISGGTEFVNSGGTVSSIIISSGGQESLHGKDFGAQVLSHGFQNVLNSGVASGATIGSGGLQQILGGIASGTIVSNGGMESVIFGSAFGTLIASGGIENVNGFALASNVTISEGTLELQAGAIVSGVINFSGSGGALDIFDSGGTLGATVGGFVQGDAIVLAFEAPNPGGSVTLDQSTNKLHAVQNGHSYFIQLDQTTDFSAAHFFLTADATPGGGTDITTDNAVACYCAGTLILTDQGEVPVEALATGEKVMTMSGVARPIR